MKQIHLRFKAKSKKITISRPFSAEDLARLISSTFELRERIVGLTDENGKFYDLNFVVKKLGEFQNKPYFLVTAKDLNEDNMSFGNFTLIQLRSITKESM